MGVDDEAKEVIWSLQKNKRKEKEQKAFQPKGKGPKKNTMRYVLGVLLGLLVLSYLLTKFQKQPVTVCILPDFCIDSEYDAVLYTLYVFMTNVILVFGIYYAYKIGKFLGNKLRK